MNQKKRVDVFQKFENKEVNQLLYRYPNRSIANLITSSHEIVLRKVRGEGVN